MLAGGTKLTPYSQEIMQAAQKAAISIYEENASQDATFKQIYEQWKKFKQQIHTWHRTNELIYNNFIMGINS